MCKEGAIGLLNNLPLAVVTCFGTRWGSVVSYLIFDAVLIRKQDTGTSWLLTGEGDNAIRVGFHRTCVSAPRGYQSH